VNAHRPLPQPAAVVRGVRRALADRRLQRRLAGPRLLALFAADHPDAFFIEIGSNDGEQHDHLRPFILAGGWSGILVEPVPYIFERLRRNYGKVAGVALVNLAIAERDGTMPFFHLAAPDAADLADLPSWYDGVGSFSRDTVLRHAEHIPDLERRIVRIDVPARSFVSLCTSHNVRRLDLLVIDTEGHDGAILRSIDLRAYRPRVIVYEHFHLAAQERGECRARLEELGWHTIEEGFDTWCVRTEPDDRLSRAALRARPAVPGVSVHDPR